MHKKIHVFKDDHQIYLILENALPLHLFPSSNY